MIVSVAAAGMLMATAAEASLGCEKKRKKRAPRGGFERATFGLRRDIGATLCPTGCSAGGKVGRRMNVGT